MILKTIYSQRIAKELLIRNHNLVKTEQNFKRKGFIIFKFEMTDKLLQDLTELSK